jgi:GxxExxY protein
MPHQMTETELSRHITQTATAVQADMGGTGMPASAYRSALTYALTEAGSNVESRTISSGNYPGVRLSQPLRVEMVVDDKVIVLCRTEANPRDEAEALTLLRGTGLKLALVINFGASNLRSAVRRVTNYE